VTSKNYIKLAEIFGDGLGRVYRLPSDSPEFDVAYNTWRALYNDTCEMLASDNPRFDEMKFQYAVAVRADMPITPVVTTTHTR